MFIAEPREVADPHADIFRPKHGLMIELKKAGTRIYKKDGTLVARGILELLTAWRNKAYMAEFACGFDEAKEIIDRYLGGK